MPEALIDFWDVWHQPLLGALHVLGIAWFGGSLFTSAPQMRRIAVLWMLATGVMLFLLNPARIGASLPFRIKMGVVAAILVVEFGLPKAPRWVMLSLWIAAIFLARWIAYF